MSRDAGRALRSLARLVLPLQCKGLRLSRGRAPYGFKHYGPPGLRRLVTCQHTRECGKKFLEWRRGGHSWAAIYNHAWHHKLLTADGREWSEGAIKRAVQGELALQEFERLHPDQPFEPDPEPYD